MRPLTAIFSVLFFATLHAETLIRVQGMDQKQADLALEKMSGRLTYVRSRPAAPSRADDAAFLMKRHLFLEGYRKVEVDWSLPGDGSILLIVQKGQRYTLGNIQFINARVANPEKHRDYFLQPFVTRKNTEQNVYPYLKEDYLEGLENLTNYLRSQGYWNAQITTNGPVFDPTTRKVHFTFTEKPGTQFTLLRPKLEVQGAVIPEKLTRKLTELTGLIASAENINKTRATIDKSFRGQGFPYLQLSMTQTNTQGKTQLEFKIITGDRFKVGKIAVEGNQRTETRHIRRRLKELQGEEFERDEADKRIRKLLGTGAFDSIQLIDQPAPNGEVNFLLRVDEAKSYGVKVYAGAGSREGGILGAGYFDRNLWGQLYNLEVDLEYSGLGILGEISLTDPFFLERDLSWQNRAFILTREYDTFQKEEAGIETSLEWEVNDYYDVRLALGISYVDLQERGDLPANQLGNSSYIDNHLTLTQSYDRRNDIALPTRGYIAELNTRFGFAAGNDSISYFSNDLRYTWYHEISKNSRIALGGRIGAINPLGNDERLPIDRRYFIGGANSVRSFGERELNPSQGANAGDDLQLGGRSYFIGNLEYIRHIAGPLKGVTFLDVGGLSTGLDFGFSDPKYAAGLGLQLDLPIGPVRLEYGYSLNRSEGEPSGTLHFSIGTAF